MFQNLRIQQEFFVLMRQYVKEQLQLILYSMKKASNYAFISKRSRPNNVSEKSQSLEMPMSNSKSSLFSLPPPPAMNMVPHHGFGGLILPKPEADLNVFVVTFQGMKNAQKNLAGGDPYQCKKCKAILNKYSKVLSAKQYEQKKVQMKIQMKPQQSYWQCEFCLYPNVIMIEKQQIPTKDDVVYMVESQHQNKVTENDSTMVFCIDVSGSMNSTSEILGKVDLKFGMSAQQIQMLKQFMEPGDEAQFNFLPGAHNQNKTFISRKQCILSAIQNQLQQLLKIDPNKRVGFITFNNEVTVLGDGKTDTVNILGDKLQKSEQIINSLKNFKLTSPLMESYQKLVANLNKTQPKGQTALGPALVSAIQVASKGSPGSTVIVCTDGLANIGIGSLDPYDESKKSFYQQLAKVAKQKNISVNIITIKGQGAKMQVIGKLAEATNGNLKVVNPQKLKDDFANVLKDQVVGLNVSTKIMLHKAMIFRNEDQNNLRDNKTVLIKQFVNATVNTKVSFQYEVREEEDLKFMEINLDDLKTVPFQAQILYTSPKGGKFLRVISSQSKTTTQKEQMKQKADIAVVHQRITTQTAALFSKGDYKGSQQYNDQWSGYLNDNFRQQKFQKKQMLFEQKNLKLNRAIDKKNKKMEIFEKPRMKQKEMEKEQRMPSHKIEKGSQLFSDLSQVKEQRIQEQGLCELKKEKKRKLSVCSMDSDEEEMQLANNLMQKQGDYEFD